jgi:hypothetical protein
LGCGRKEEGHLETDVAVGMSYETNQRGEAALVPGIAQGTSDGPQDIGVLLALGEGDESGGHLGAPASLIPVAERPVHPAARPIIASGRRRLGAPKRRE